MSDLQNDEVKTEVIIDKQSISSLDTRNTNLTMNIEKETTSNFDNLTVEDAENVDITINDDTADQTVYNKEEINHDETKDSDRMDDNAITENVENFEQIEKNINENDVIKIDNAINEMDGIRNDVEDKYSENFDTFENDIKDKDDDDDMKNVVSDDDAASHDDNTNDDQFEDDKEDSANDNESRMSGKKEDDPVDKSIDTEDTVTSNDDAVVKTNALPIVNTDRTESSEIESSDKVDVDNKDGYDADSEDLVDNGKVDNIVDFVKLEDTVVDGDDSCESDYPDKRDDQSEQIEERDDRACPTKKVVIFERPIEKELKCPQKTLEDIEAIQILDETVNVENLTCEELDKKYYMEYFDTNKLKVFHDYKRPQKPKTDCSVRPKDKIPTRWEIISQRPRSDIINRRSIYEPLEEKNIKTKYSKKRLEQLSNARIEPEQFLAMADKELPVKVKKSTLNGKISARVEELAKPVRVFPFVAVTNKPKSAVSAKTELNAVINNLAKPRLRQNVESDQSAYKFCITGKGMGEKNFPAENIVSSNLYAPRDWSVKAAAKIIPAPVSPAALHYNPTKHILDLAKPKQKHDSEEFNPFAVKKSALRYKPSQRVQDLAMPIVRASNPG